MIKVLSIAGSDPSSGAGIQADLKVFQALGVYGMAIPVALTAQNSRGVSAIYTAGPKAFSAQVDALLSDITPDALKTGMLLMPWAVRTVAKATTNYGIKNLIIDPVIRSSSGEVLLKPDAIRSLRKNLLPLALVLTPNIPEAETLAGLKIKSKQDMDLAAGQLLDMGPQYILIKGGHARGPAVDTLYGGKTVLSFSTKRRKGDFHGTGCVLSSAITVFIAQGFPVEKAVEKAKLFVDSLLITAKPIGKSGTKYFQL